MPRQPNVILILTDDQGYGDLSCFGNDRLRTPHLDRLAHEGVRLTQHYSASPICAPARGALLTGRYNHRIGALSVESNRGADRIGLAERTMADVFKRAGYATGLVGKWHSGLHDMRYHPNSRGFDEFAGFLNGIMNYWDWIIEHNGRPQWSDGRYLTDVFTTEAVQFIGRHRNEPFLLHVAYNAPHSPLEAPDDAVRPYADSADLTPAVRTLYGMLGRMDDGVGRILDALEAHGLTRDTIVLFASDNGPVLTGQGDASLRRYNGPFRGMKYDVLEGGVRVPGLVRWPAGLPAGAEHRGMVHFCDWLPTLASACGIEIDSALALDGVDQLGALQGEREAVNPKRFWQFNRYDPVAHCNAAMRDGPWKLYWPPIPEAMRKLPADNPPAYKNCEVPHFLMDVENPPVERELSPAGAPELYHIDDDPCEQHNLAAEQPERVSRMQCEFENWFDEVEKERRQ